MRHESVPMYWRNIPQYYRLVAKRCRQCGAVYFPPALRCRCGSAELEDYDELPHEGRLVEYTVLYQVGTDFLKQKPLIVGLVELNGGVRAVGQIVDAQPDRLAPGTRVELVFRRVAVDGRHGLIMYGYKFRPVQP
ncbi:MAG: Zn-ribbon domain-containing OB-fold protein [Thermoproteaceae archaeon]|nr:Zn-ribbon domain-containing OB-fold protein [Thermoproteaceae archaeon]